MIHLIRKHHISFKNAWTGIIWAFTTQPNFRVHLLLSFVTICLGFFFNISYIEIIILVLVIILGLSAEMINTALESMTDLITLEYRKEAKIAKDVSAGMMLLVSIGAVFIACLIFLPKLVAFIK